MKPISRLRSILGRRRITGEQAFWLAAAAITGALSVMKGLRRPNLWAATGLQLDYSQGLIKRGLLGETLERLHLPVGHMAFVQGFAAVTAGVLAVSLLALAWRAARRDVWLVVALALFASSAAPAYIAHLIGYPDLVLAALAVGLASLSPGGWRLAVLAVGSVAAVLVHEDYLLLFLPVTLLPTILDALGRMYPSPARSAWRLASAAQVAVIGAATALVLSLEPPLSAGRMARLLHDRAADADFALRPDVFDVLRRSAADNIAATAAYPFWNDNLAGLLMFAPSTALLVFWAWRRLGILPAGWRRASARAAVIGAVAAPLIMHVIGWDHFRWDAWALFDAFVALCIVTLRVPHGPDTLVGEAPSARTRWAVLLLILLNVGTGGGFMDARTPRLFPYTDVWTGWPHAAPSKDEDEDAAAPSPGTAPSGTAQRP